MKSELFIIHFFYINYVMHLVKIRHMGVWH